MNVLRSLLSVALLSYPRTFRREYRDAILRDAENDPDRLAYYFADMMKDGVAMRFDDFTRDLNYALSRLRRTPMFVAIVTLTFALGIGANVAVFSAFNAIVLRPLPYAHAERLVTISKRVAPQGGPGGPVTELDVSDVRPQLHGVTSIDGVAESRPAVSVNGVSKGRRGAEVGTGLLGSLGIAPEIGRLFQAADAKDGVRNIVISDGMWRTDFNGDPAALGKHVTLDGELYTIVGVVPADTQVPEPFGGTGGELAQPDFYTAMADASPSYKRGIGGSVGAVASLAPGTTIEQLNAQLLVASDRVQSLYPHDRMNQSKVTFVAQPLGKQLIGPLGSTLWLILVSVLGILLIACANVANLIASRWSARDREVAVRRALGASTRRIAVQLFIETGVLALCGGVAAVVLAYAGLRFIPFDAISAIPRAQAIAIDPATLLYALIMVCLATVLSGFVPVLLLGRSELQLVLNSAGRSGDASRGHGLRAALVVAEVAIAFALVISSGLIIRSFVTILHSPLGFNADGLYVSDFQTAENDSPALWPQEAAQQQQLLARVAALPGVDSAAIARTAPLGGAFGAITPRVQDVNCPLGRCPYATSDGVSPGYFHALGVPLLRGRDFSARDSANSGLVAIVSQDFVDKFLHGGDAVGRRVSWWGSWITIVGVVPNITQTLHVPSLPVIYTPIAQHPLFLFSLVVRAPRATPAAIQSELRPVFASIYPAKEPPSAHTVSDTIALVTQTQRFAATLLGALGLVSLLLALSGIYGVVSFSIAQRSREFGIRIALGARTPVILGDVLRRSLSTSAIGVVFGLVLAALDARAIAPYLTQAPDMAQAFAGTAPQVLASPFDPLTFGAVILLIFACTALAALLPAVRATQVDPSVSLRYE